MLQIIASRYDKAFTWDVKVKMMGKKHEDSAQIFIGKSISVFFVFCYLCYALLLLLWLFSIHWPTVSEMLSSKKIY